MMRAAEGRNFKLIESKLRFISRHAGDLRRRLLPRASGRGDDAARRRAGATALGGTSRARRHLRVSQRLPEIN
jgi:hypothetical protein